MADDLTPLQDMCMEVLAARWRLGGEDLWTFPKSVKRALDALSAKGLVATAGGVTEGTVRASLTPAGKSAALSDTYPAPNEIAWPVKVRDAEPLIGRLVMVAGHHGELIEWTKDPDPVELCDAWELVIHTLQGQATRIRFLDAPRADPYNGDAMLHDGRAAVRMVPADATVAPPGGTSSTEWRVIGPDRDELTALRVPPGVDGDNEAAAMAEVRFSRREHARLTTAGYPDVDRLYPLIAQSRVVVTHPWVDHSVPEES